MLTENLGITSEEKIIKVVSEAISNGIAQSACIWNIIQLEKGSYPVNDTPQMREEWNARYREINAFVTQKGLRVLEISPLIDGFKKDVRRLLGLA